MTRETAKKLSLIGAWSAIGLLALSLSELIFHLHRVEPQYLATFAVLLFIASIVASALLRNSAEKQREHWQQNRPIPRFVAMSLFALCILVGIGVITGLSSSVSLKWAVGTMNILMTVVAVGWWFRQGGGPDRKVIGGLVGAAIGWVVFFHIL